MSGKMNGQLATILAILLSVLTACDSGSKSPASSATSADRQSIAGSNEDRGNGENVPAEIEPAKPVVAEMLPYAEVDEQLVYGYFAFPADMVDPLPGVIVIHERWGLDDGVRALADRIAGQGFVVLAVDLYGGETTTDIAGARSLMVDVVENAELANENIRQAYQFLIDSGEAPKIASLGWSFGGGWALNTAMLFPEDLDAAVVYYGQVTASEERLAPITAPILGLFGENGIAASLLMVSDHSNRRWRSLVKNTKLKSIRASVTRLPIHWLQITTPKKLSWPGRRSSSS